MATTEYRVIDPLANPAAEHFVPKFLYSHAEEKNPVYPDIAIRDDFYGTKRKLRIGVLGAGLSGLQFLHFAESLSDVEIVVYDQNEDVGGVWCSSVYPGCRCDFPSWIYQFTWSPRIWNEMFASRGEIFEYLQTVATENNFYPLIKLRHEILKASWSDESAKWTLDIRDLTSGLEFQDHVDFFVELHGAVRLAFLDYGLGTSDTMLMVYSKPVTPNLPGIEDFEGPVIHTAKWPRDTVLKDKKVAVLGYGSSGVQVVPNIVDEVAVLYTWFRNQFHMLPPPGSLYSPSTGGSNYTMSETQKEILNDQDTYLAFAKSFDQEFNARSAFIINGSEVSDGMTDFSTSFMQKKLLGRSDLLDLIVPTKFKAGCRRPVFSHGYLEALTHKHTTVLPKPPIRFTRHGMLDHKGKEIELDLVIAATGYDQDHQPRFPIYVNDQNIIEQWKTLPAPPSYLGVMYQGLPNFFNPAAAFAPLQSGNYYMIAETNIKYIVQVIEKVQNDRIVAVAPKSRAAIHFVRHARSWVKRTVFAGPCASYFKGNDGVSNLPSLWPGERSQHIKVMRSPRFEDFDIVYENPDNIFSFLGNGWDRETWSITGSDKAWYLKNPSKDVSEALLRQLSKPEES